MDFERKQIIEIVVAVGATAMMFAAMFFVGSNYGGNEGGLTPTGGEMLVFAIVGFILVLAAAGVGLAYALNEPEDGLDDEPETDGGNVA